MRAALGGLGVQEGVMKGYEESLGRREIICSRQKDRGLRTLPDRQICYTICALGP